MHGLFCPSIAHSSLLRRSAKTVCDYPHSVRHYLYGGGNGVHWHFFLEMQKTVHPSMFIYDFCYFGEEDTSSCDFVPRAVKILVLLFDSSKLWLRCSLSPRSRLNVKFSYTLIVLILLDNCPITS